MVVVDCALFVCGVRDHDTGYCHQNVQPTIIGNTNVFSLQYLSVLNIMGR